MRRTKIHRSQLFIWLMIMFCIIAINATAQIAIDSVVSLKNETNSIPWIIPFDVADNLNRVMVVGISKEETVVNGGLDQISSIRYGAKNLIKIVDGGFSTGDYATENELWMLVAPQVGANTLVVHYSNADVARNLHIVIYSIYNAEQSTSVMSNFSTSVGVGNDITTTISTTDKESLVIDLAASGEGTNVYTELSAQSIDIRFNNFGHQTTTGGHYFTNSIGDYISSYRPNQSCNRQSLVALAINALSPPEEMILSSSWHLVGGTGVIWPSGQVAINVDSIATDYTLQVNGTISAEEIKVEVQNVPDYVFEADYPLTSLAAVEEFIKVNGHLPGIAPAHVLEQTGIQSGEFNMLLLRKIEELTLYMIQLKSSQEKTQAINQKLEEDLVKLKGQLIKAQQKRN